MVAHILALACRCGDLARVCILIPGCTRAAPARLASGIIDFARRTASFQKDAWISTFLNRVPAAVLLVLRGQLAQHTMKNLRPGTAPTRSRRLNELLGLMTLAGAGLLLLALATYTPTDPSFNAAGAYSSGRAAHNWIGLLGAYVSDALLQLFGVAAFFLPVLMVRLALRWMRSRSAGSTLSKLVGVLLWLVSAPALFALLPGGLLWRHTLPIEGVSGRIISDALITYVNLPGAAVIVTLLVAVSIYLSTSFTLGTARAWLITRFSFFRSLHDRWSQWRLDRTNARAEVAAERFGTRRELSERQARKAEAESAADREKTTLVNSLFSWWSRRRMPVELKLESSAGTEAGEPVSVWEAMPRTLVDAPAMTPLTTALAAAAPYTEALANASAPLRAAEVDSNFAATDAEEFDFLTPEPQLSAARSLETIAPGPLAQPVMSKPLEKVAAAQPAYAEPKDISFGKRADSGLKAVAITPKSIRGYKLPPSSLLFRSEEHAIVREDALREEARVLVEKGAEFDVDGQVTQINPGPVVTTFEFKPDAGVKYSRVTGLADDLCLAMAAESILIERMAGKSTVGIQVPNSERETIWLRDVVECESFAQSKSRLAIALGKDINGRIVTADLAAMPHVLIAGSTGSGKSVAINAMIMSVLFKSTPEQVRMILVDPKRVELGMYEGIPHLFTPIITEAKLAANALRNAVREMERRLKLLASHHVRNIDQYNKMVENATPDMFEDPADQEPLPYIMIIIDELADLMMLDRSNVEEAITRLAQMARAVGIHLVLATQRPSVDVITGLIKANVPTRMSFRLATKVDSRTIIDSNGAESLLGRGDMLYLPPGTSRVQRVHAPFVTEKEINAVTEFWKAQGEADYVQGFLEGPKDEKSGDGETGDGGDANDELYDDAVRLVFEFGKASTSLLQRRLRIGYGRAAHLIDMMHRDGLVGPADGSKPRELLKPATWLKEIDAAIR